MTSPENSLGKFKLEEGDILDFLIRNKVKMQDNQDYYILEDPYGQRHFIEAGIYSAFGLQPGQMVECRVDRINCTGRIFLEPRHPYYSEGKIYDFQLLAELQRKEKKILVIEDIFKNQLELEVSGDNSFLVHDLKMLKCKVKRIKKGRPEVEIVT